MQEGTSEKAEGIDVGRLLEELAGGDRPWTNAEGQAIVEAWRASGLRRLEFCQKHGLRFHKLAWWASKKGRERVESRARPPEFREVKVVRRASVELAADPSAGASRMEVTLANGCRIQVGPGFDVVALERLFAVVVRAC